MLEWVIENICKNAVDAMQFESDARLIFFLLAKNLHEEPSGGGF